jgi:ribonuclease VapC
MSSSAITAVNLAGAVKKLREKGVPRRDVEANVSDLQIPLEPGPTDLQQSIDVGQIAASCRAFGLSMGDAACLAVAGRSGRIPVTARRRLKLESSRFDNGAAISRGPTAT